MTHENLTAWCKEQGCAFATVSGSGEFKLTLMYAEELEPLQVIALVHLVKNQLPNNTQIEVTAKGKRFDLGRHMR